MLKSQIDLDKLSLLFALTSLIFIYLFLRLAVLDDEDSNNITVGSLVTVLLN